MAEYLEKSAVIKAIHDEIYSGGNWSGGWYERPEEAAEKNFTKRINAITPVIREHGKWIQKNYWSEGCGMGESYGYYYECSKCGNLVKGDYDKCRDQYCSRCGADMRGEKQ